MKRTISFMLAALLLLGAAPAVSAAASAVDSAQNAAALLSGYTPEELLQQWLAVRALLRADGAYPFSELEKGDTGYEVTALQTRLKELGYYQKEIVDNFGNGTYNAMRDFEKANGLPVNGAASVADQQVLFGSAVSESGAVPAADTAASLDEPLNAYTTEELLQYWVQAGDWLRTNGTYPFTELKQGDVGYEVTALQTRLKELGYYQKEIVDNFGSGTHNALRALEKNLGLTADGVASASDQQVIFSSAAAAYVDPNRSNVSNGGNGGRNDATSGATP